MTATVLYMIAGVVLGVGIGWLLATARARSAAAVAEERGRQLQIQDDEFVRLRGELDVARQGKTEALTRLDESQKNLREQKDLLDAMEGKLSETFKALSLEALSKN